VLDASLLKKLFKLLKIQNLNEDVESEVYRFLELISLVNKKFFLLVLDNPEYVQQCISGVLNVLLCLFLNNNGFFLGLLGCYYTFSQRGSKSK